LAISSRQSYFVVLLIVFSSVAISSAERRYHWKMRGVWSPRYLEHYNSARLNSAIAYITPKDMIAGLQLEIQAERDGKLEGGANSASEQRLLSFKLGRRPLKQTDLSPRLPRAGGL
jgi:hypothetical protein